MSVCLIMLRTNLAGGCGSPVALANNQVAQELEYSLLSGYGIQFIPLDLS